MKALKAGSVGISDIGKAILTFVLIVLIEAIFKQAYVMLFPVYSTFAITMFVVINIAAIAALVRYFSKKRNSGIYIIIIIAAVAIGLKFFNLHY